MKKEITAETNEIQMTIRNSYEQLHSKTTEKSETNE